MDWMNGKEGNCKDIERAAVDGNELLSSMGESFNFQGVNAEKGSRSEAYSGRCLGTLLSTDENPFLYRIFRMKTRGRVLRLCLNLIPCLLCTFPLLELD